MRVYKINDLYIDLDHVLMVSELIFWEHNYGYDTPDDAWFYITLAFRDKKKRIGLKYEGDDFRGIIRGQYEDFLKAWQNK